MDEQTNPQAPMPETGEVKPEETQAPETTPETAPAEEGEASQA